MHEASLAYQLLEAVRAEAARHGLRRISHVTVGRGAGSGIEHGFLEENLDLMRRDPLLAAATFSFVADGDGDWLILEIRGETEAG